MSSFNPPLLAALSIEKVSSSPRYTISCGSQASSPDTFLTKQFSARGFHVGSGGYVYFIPFLLGIWSDPLANLTGIEPDSEPQSCRHLPSDFDSTDILYTALYAVPQWLGAVIYT